MRILIIGQLPKEIGGNYTTGAANVVYELSKQREDGVLYYTYGTNITDSAAIKASRFCISILATSSVLSVCFLQPCVILWTFSGT